jgi:hypothetical protein
LNGEKTTITNTCMQNQKANVRITQISINITTDQ